MSEKPLSSVDYESIKNNEGRVENQSASNKEPQAPPSLWKSASFIAGVTLIAKALGFFRDWQIFHIYGASLATDAYFAAVQLPWYSVILLGGLGGPFHSMVVAIFGKWVTPPDTPSHKINQLASAFVVLVGLVFVVLSVLTYFYATPIMSLLLRHAKPELLALSAQHLRILAPMVFFGGWLGIFYGLLNIYHHFLWPSLSPAAMSVVIIATLAWQGWRGEPDQGQMLAWATVVGALAQLLVQCPVLLRFGWRPAVPDWKPLLPELKQLGEMIFPLVIGTTIGQVMVYVDMAFVSQLEEGGWAAVILSNRLMQLPIGVLQTAMLVPIFPRFSRAVADKNWSALRDDIQLGVVTLWIISVPMLIIIVLLGGEYIRLIFEHGEFTERDTAMVTLALTFQAVQMVPYFARDTLTRVFYAFEDARTPMFVGLFAIGMKYLLNTVLVKQFGLGGITLSTSIITAINMIILGTVLHYGHFKPLGKTYGVRLLLLRLGQLLFAGVPVAAVLWLSLSVWMPWVHHPQLLVQWGALIGLSVLIMMCYWLVVSKMPVPEVNTLNQRLKCLLPF